VCLIRRSRRRSGSGLVRVGSEVGTLEKKRAVDDVTAGESPDMVIMMSTLDNGPHRELPVDVPDSFIAHNKTPPRYPPPSRATRTAGIQVRGQHYLDAYDLIAQLRPRWIIVLLQFAINSEPGTRTSSNIFRIRD